MGERQHRRDGRGWSVMTKSPTKAVAASVGDDWSDTRDLITESALPGASWRNFHGDRPARFPGFTTLGWLPRRLGLAALAAVDLARLLPPRCATPPD
jgi:hypothetical protein